MTKAEILMLPFVAVILILQSTWLFLDARKNGHNYWIWGLLGLIQAPMPSLIYLVFVKRVLSKR